MSKPIVLYSHPAGPNPWKVAILLEELGVAYDTKVMDFSELKNDSPFEQKFINGRVPAIEDPNTGINLWESGAIIEYLLATYDKENKFDAAGDKAHWDAKAWLHFQTSGQGPYYGQKAWFTLFHSEKGITSAIERYGAEVKRVISVIDRHLKKNGTEYLTGDKITYADLAFVPWHWLVLSPPGIMGPEFAKEWETTYPNAWAWHQKMDARPAVKKCKDERAALMAKGH